MRLIAAVQDCGYCPGAENPSLPFWVPTAVAVAGLAGATLLVVTAAILRIQGRKVPAWMAPATALGYGMGVSLMVVSWSLVEEPIALALLVAGVVLPVAIAGQARRFDLGGWVLVGAGLPAVVWWGQYVLQDVLHESISYEEGLVVWFGSAVGVTLAGLAGIGLGNRVSAAPPRLAPDEPDPDRTVAIARAFQEELQFGPIDFPNAVSVVVGIAAGTAVAFALRRLSVPDLATGIAWGVTFTLVATELFYHVWPQRLARAMGTHAFVGSAELDRFRRTVGPMPPTSAGAARDWLASHPESDANRWVRPELLAWTGEVAEAYDVIDRMPASTDAERFDRLAMKALVDLVSGAEADVEGLAAIAETAGASGSDEQLRALAVVALQRSRERLVGGGEDWMAPLLEVQERIGPRSLGILRSDTWLTRLKALALVSGVFVALGLLLAYLSG